MKYEFAKKHTQRKWRKYEKLKNENYGVEM